MSCLFLHNPYQTLYFLCLNTCSESLLIMYVSDWMLLIRQRWGNKHEGWQQVHRWRCFSLSSSPFFFISSFMLPLNESSCKQSIAHTHAHTCTRCCYAQETINYASLLTRAVTRQKNRETKLARALATEKLPQPHTLDHSLLHLFKCSHTPPFPLTQICTVCG